MKRFDWNRPATPLMVWLGIGGVTAFAVGLFLFGVFVAVRQDWGKGRFSATQTTSTTAAVEATAPATIVSLPTATTTPPAKPAAMTPEEREKFMRDEAEVLLAKRDGEYRLLDREDQKAIERIRPQLAQRPMKDLKVPFPTADVPDEVTLRRLLGFFNMRDARAYFIFIASRMRGPGMAITLGLKGDKAEWFQVRLGMWNGDLFEIRELEYAVGEAGTKGASGMSNDSKKLVRRLGFQEFFANIKD